MGLPSTDVEPQILLLPLKPELVCWAQSWAMTGEAVGTLV